MTCITAKQATETLHVFSVITKRSADVSVQYLVILDDYSISLIGVSKSLIADSVVFLFSYYCECWVVLLLLLLRTSTLPKIRSR